MSRQTLMHPKRLGASLLVCMSLLGGCGEPEPPVFQGYVEGEYVYLASARAGRLETLLTERGKTVDKNALLFELEAEHERQVLRQAEEEHLSATAQLNDMKTGKRPEEVAMATAQLDQARADALNALTMLQRNETLIRKGGVSRKELDDSRAAAQAATARVAELTSQLDVYRLPAREQQIKAQQAVVSAAEARVAQNRWEVAQKRLHAPAKSLVYDTLFREGEWVPAGSPVVQLLPPENMKIRFFVPETLIGVLQTGQSVSVRLDGRPEPLRAVISYIAPNAEYTPPIIYSNETRSKLVFMVEARPEQDMASGLHPGQPVSVSLP